MDLYKKLYNKGYLKGDKKNSPLNIKGIEMLSKKYKNDYNFIDIINIKEKEFSDEFNKFFEIYQNIKNEKNYKEFENAYDKIVFNEFNSQEEDELFLELKEFNLKHKNIKQIQNKQILITILKLKNFSSKFIEITNDLMCKRIFYISKRNELTFFIWINDDESHYSLVCNIDDYYFFFDSCSIFYNRYPSKRLISSNMNDGLFIKGKVIYMKSFLQYDDYNCGSFIFAFIDIFAKYFISFNFNKGDLINYFLKYFNTYSNEDLLTEFYSYNFDENSLDFGKISIYYLPFEFLELSQSTSELHNLKNTILDNDSKNKINDIISLKNDKHNVPTIENIRLNHLNYLVSI